MTCIDTGAALAVAVSGLWEGRHELEQLRKQAKELVKAAARVDRLGGREPILASSACDGALEAGLAGSLRTLAQRAGAAWVASVEVR